MGLLGNTRKSVAESIYNKSVKPNLKQSDGLLHVVMINSFSKLANQLIGCEDKYTIQIDEILTDMQKDGYQIVDIKFNSLKNQGLTGNTEGYETLIMYK